MPDYTSPDWDRSALVMIDVQNDFVRGPFSIAGTEDRLDAMAVVLDRFRKHRRPIVHVVRSYVPGESDVDLIRRSSVESGGKIVAPATDGADIPVELLCAAVELDWQSLRSNEPQRVGELEYVMYKPRWSAFHRTPLEDILTEHDVNTAVIAGCNLPNCPRATLFDASERDYRTVLVTDATSQVTEERLSDLALIGVHLCSSGETLPVSG